MKPKIRLFALFLTFALLLICLAGCEHGPEPLPETSPASGPADDDYPPKADQTQDPYGDYLLSDAIEPGKYSPPTDEVVAEADAWLAARENAVHDFWEKNKPLLEKAARQFIAISEQYGDLEYIYEIADKNLVTRLSLTEADPEETAQRTVLTETLEKVSELPGTDAFERVCYNTWALDIPFCAFSGTIKVFDGIGCYVSLGYLSREAPKNLPCRLKKLDDHWAVLTFRKNRDEMGMTVPSDKCAEVYRVQMAKQAWDEYRFLNENRELMEQVITEMVAMTTAEPGYPFVYDFEKKEFKANSFRKGPYEGDGASDELLEKLDALAASPGIDTFSYVEAFLYEDDPANDYDEESLSCAFCGQWLTFNGEGYWYDLNYTPDEAPEELSYSECIKLDEHWYLSSQYTPG